MISDGFFCYKHYGDIAKEVLNPEQYKEYLVALMELGWNKSSESHDPVIRMCLRQAAASMDASDRRYKRSVRNGKRGGRPRIFTDDELIDVILDTHMTSSKELAKYFECSVRTIVRRKASKRVKNFLASYNKRHKKK